ncbi:MAG: phosphate ABC transporter permease subunit PstC [Acidimicrobiia bacterium]|nr:phosphate ABC transporter permease subunit PstC [Acidimicrobiia bacterium]
MTATSDSVDLRGEPRRLRKEQRMRRLFLGMAIVSIAVSIAIVASLLGNAVGFFVDVDKGSLLDVGWFPRRNRFDLLTPIAGTLVMSLVAMLVATPLGLGAAIYLAEYAKPRVRRLLKPVLEILAGIPSVVLGFFALLWIGPNVVVELLNSPKPATILTASIGVGILVTPLVASVSEDALRAVPQALREASYGLGAKKSTTVRSVVLPAAVSGIMASLILGLSRAIGETMVTFMAAGAVGGALRTWNPLDSGTTLTAAIASVATGSDQVAGEALAFEGVFALGITLFFITLVLNWMSDRFVRRVRQKY